eukprot:scaffold395749_cov55-Attheya_sp.AAC.3
MDVPCDFFFMMDELPTTGYSRVVPFVVGFEIGALSPEASFDSAQPILSFDIMIRSENIDECTPETPPQPAYPTRTNCTVHSELIGSNK